MSRLIAIVPFAFAIGSSIALGEDLKLPPLQKQPTPQAVIDEHFDALNNCDWNRIMAQYPADYQLNLPGGMVVKGREKAGELFATFVLNIQWKAEADILAQAYKGSDAYETHDGLMAGMVSTFKGEDLKMKEVATGSSTRNK
jgi:ketosteroid isomerase-like protein